MLVSLRSLLVDVTAADVAIATTTTTTTTSTAAVVIIIFVVGVLNDIGQACAIINARVAAGTIASAITTRRVGGHTAIAATHLTRSTRGGGVIASSSRAGGSGPTAMVTAVNRMATRTGLRRRRRRYRQAQNPESR